MGRKRCGTRHTSHGSMVASHGTQFLPPPPRPSSGFQPATDRRASICRSSGLSRYCFRHQTQAPEQSCPLPGTLPTSRLHQSSPSPQPKRRPAVTAFSLSAPAVSALCQPLWVGVDSPCLRLCRQARLRNLPQPSRQRLRPDHPRPEERRRFFEE